MSKRIPVRVIHTQKEGYVVEMYVAPKLLKDPKSGFMPTHGIWRTIKVFGHNFNRAWKCRNEELKGVGVL